MGCGEVSAGQAVSEIQPSVCGFEVVGGSERVFGRVDVVPEMRQERQGCSG